MLTFQKNKRLKKNKYNENQTYYYFNIDTSVML